MRRCSGPARLLLCHVNFRRGVAVGRDAQRVVAVGQRSIERSLQMQVASANELPSCEARPGLLSSSALAKRNSARMGDSVGGAFHVTYVANLLGLSPVGNRLALHFARCGAGVAANGTFMSLT